MQLGLIGKSLVHSFSASYFKAKFEDLGLKNYQYHNCELNSISEFPALIAHQKWQGFNVTIPYKETIIPFLAGLSVDAEAIGAVNTLVPSEQGWIGYNTDHLGFARALKERWSQANFQNALILGTGGAAKAVVFALSQMACHCQWVSRQPIDGQIDYQEAARRISDFELIVNTTPLGTFPEIDAAPPLKLPSSLEGQYCIDLIYNPPQSAFLKNTSSLGAEVMNGAAMLKWQAEYAWQLWQEAMKS